MKRKPIIALVLTALLAAIATVLFFFPKFPIFPAAAHVKFDFSNLPGLLAGILLGPLYGVAVELIKNLIELLTTGVGSQMGFGNLMNFTVGCAFILPFSLIVRKSEKPRVVIACVTSLLIMLVVGVGMNLVITPLFFRFFLGQDLPRAMLFSVAGYATAVNAIKGAILCAAGVVFCRLKPRMQNMLG